MDQNIIKSFSVFLIKFYLNYFSIIYNFFKTIKFFQNILNYFKSYLINIKIYLIYFEKDLFINHSNYIFKNYINSFKLFNTVISKTVYNFYNSDIFSKKSKIMILASKKIKNINF